MKDTKIDSEISRDIIYLEIDDEVTIIFERVKNSRKKNVVLVTPARSQILQSLVNLKILRFKSENVGKIVTITTKDSIGRQLAVEAGLDAAESVHVHGKKTQIKNKQSRQLQPQDLNVKKIGRRKLKILATDDKEKDLRKLSSDEIPLAKINPTRGFKKFWQKISRTVVDEEENNDESKLTRLVVHTPSHKLLLGLISAAVALLFFIIYVAVPTATIYITPRVDPISKVVNVVLTDRVSTQGQYVASAHTVPSEFLDFTFSQAVRIGATGQLFEGTSAGGMVTIFNRSPRDKFIVPSRFQSPDGIIFHTKKVLTIPKAIGDEAGSILAEVKACKKDDPKCDCINEPDSCEGNFVGERGNIGPNFFIMPAIPSLSPALYWAESIEPMTGGVTKIKKFITEEDIAQIQETVTREIIALAKIEILDLLNQKNRLENRNLVLLDNPKAIQTEILSIDVPTNLVDKFQDEFTVAVKVRVYAVAYEEDDLRALLFKQLETKVHPEKILTKVKFENAAYDVELAKLLKGKIKLAITIGGVEEYDLGAKTVAGERLVEKIRNRILGKDVEEAEAYVRNLPEINNAIISSWPFWARTIPELPENVKFELKQ